MDTDRQIEVGPRAICGDDLWRLDPNCQGQTTAITEGEGTGKSTDFPRRRHALFTAV
jgi:hypothetical protein